MLALIGTVGCVFVNVPDPKFCRTRYRRATIGLTRRTASEHPGVQRLPHGRTVEIAVGDLPGKEYARERRKKDVRPDHVLMTIPGRRKFPKTS